jgi:hypothetical protein
MDMPSGVCVAAMDFQVERPTAMDFQPPLNPRWLAAFTYTVRSASTASRWSSAT